MLLTTVQRRLNKEGHPAWKEVSEAERKLAYQKFDKLTSKAGIKMSRCVGSWTIEFLLSKYWQHKYEEWRASRYANQALIYLYNCLIYLFRFASINGSTSNDRDAGSS